MNNDHKLEISEIPGIIVDNNNTAVITKVTPKFDRVTDWDQWASIMHSYIASFTVAKYGDDDAGFDLMCVTEPRICVWNILKYALRLWRGKGKIHDIHKICHYAQMAYTLSKGDLKKAGITNEKGD